MDNKGYIILFYAWGTSNAGDHALCLGALELISLVVPIESIVVVSRYKANYTSNNGDASSNIQQLFPGVKVIPSPFGFSRETSIQKLLQYSQGFLVALAGIVLSKIHIPFLRRYQPFRELNNARLVLLNGGNLFYWHQVRRAPARLVAFALPLVLANNLGIPYGLLPNTSGPFDQSIISRLIGGVYQRAQFVMFRDTQSLKNTRKIADLSKTKAYVLPDLAFFLTEKKTVSEMVMARCGCCREDFLAVVLRVAPLGLGISKRLDNPENTTTRLMGMIPDVLAKVQKETLKKILIVEQSDDDKEISQMIFAALKSKGNNVQLLRLRDPYEFIGLYANASALFSMRLHSMIFALGQGTPVVGLWRKELGEKIPSMMEDLGLKEYAFELMSTDPDQLCQAIIRTVIRRTDLRFQITKYNENRKQKALDVLSEFL